MSTTTLMAREPGKRDDCRDEATRIVAIIGVTIAVAARLTYFAHTRWIRRGRS